MRLIDADALYYKVKCECNPYGKPSIDFESGKKVLNWIEQARTVERPHGEWGKWVISEVRCPECLEYFDADCYSKEEMDKCPNCGADMRPKEGDEK